MFHFMIINLCEFIIEWYKPRFYYVHFFYLQIFTSALLFIILHCVLYYIFLKAEVEASNYLQI